MLAKTTSFATKMSMRAAKGLKDNMLLGTIPQGVAPDPGGLGHPGGRLFVPNGKDTKRDRSLCSLWIRKWIMVL